MLPFGPHQLRRLPLSELFHLCGQPYFIDLELLIEDGLLTRDEVESQNWGTNPRYVDYGRIYESRFAVLQKAKDRGWERDQEEVAAFQAENSRWLPDYALYMACKRHFGMRSWTEWDDADIRLRRSPEVLEQYRTPAAGGCGAVHLFAVPVLPPVEQAAGLSPQPGHPGHR